MRPNTRYAAEAEAARDEHMERLMHHLHTTGLAREERGELVMKWINPIVTLEKQLLNMTVKLV